MIDFRPFSQFQKQKAPCLGAFFVGGYCISLRNGNALGRWDDGKERVDDCISLRNGNALGL